MDAQPVQRTSALLIMLSIIFAGGCRMPWKPMQLSQRSLETADPDFEGLLRAEREASNEYSDEFDFAERQRVNRRPGVAGSARGSISDSDFDSDVAAAEGELSPEQAAMLRKQMELVSELRRQADSHQLASQEPPQVEADDGPQEFSLSDMDSDIDNVSPDKIAAFEQKIAAAKEKMRRQSDMAASTLANKATEAADLGAVAMSSMQAVATGKADDAVSRASYEANSHSSSYPTDEISPDVRNVPVAPNTRGRSELSWKEMVAEARQILDDQLAAAASPEHRVELEKSRRLLSLSINDLPAAMEPVPGIEKSLQEYYRYTMQGWNDATNPRGHPDPRKRAALALSSQRKATRQLAAASDLSVSNASFCSVVNSYGNVERFEAYDFKPGDEVLLYCEVDNFVSQKLPNGKDHETNLRGTYKIYDAASGRPVDQQSLPANREVSKTVRRDYFMVYRIWLPNNLVPGSYELKLDIEDLHGSKFGSETIEFRIVQ